MGRCRDNAAGSTKIKEYPNQRTLAFIKRKENSNSGRS